MKKYDELEKQGIKWEDSFLFVERMDVIPCGRCAACQAARAKAWAERLMIEKTLHEDSWFVTLTFNEKYLERLCATGKYESYTVRVEHLQKFLKRLRKKFGFPIRFFACGEYGEKYLRPHYHLIIFGLTLPEDDLSFLRYNELGQPYYSSKLISELWSNPDKGPEKGESYGFNVVAPVSYDTCAYVARYCMKKLRGQDSLLYELCDMKPPFITMSRNPGIGYWWLVQNPDWYQQDLIYLSTPTGSLSMVPPRYFEKKLALVDGNEVKLRSDHRKYFRQLDLKARLSQTNYSEYDYVKVVESNLKKSLDMLTALRK